ncbi:uncharacterized protein LOC131884712 [Tigriopus californicus]|uniref:uncharacterized protein LOC131884712 n=1 Tax=Tigriopus californicus TaxID=6832 RepID=UPI0027DA9F2C|nr:uncharacterized protein LOC131884712 [Tigriopus californicus]
MMPLRPPIVVLLILIIGFLSNSVVKAQCPWGQDQRFLPLQSACICNLNPEQALSVQCQLVNFTILMGALHRYSQGSVIELLYINNSTVGSLPPFAFKNLKIISLQISAAEIIEISDNAFRGLENTLQNLNLANNQLRTIPVQPLRQLRLVSLLDLSQNRIKFVPDNAFVTLRLKTLKLAENNLTVSDNALRGLDSSLKNLNLKACQLKQIPEGIRKLHGLAFLDLAQNNIRNVEPGTFQELHSLTALNLERNIIQKLHPDVFAGIADTLTSLSLLNNLLTEYPLQAVMGLKGLRVLDLGFNLLRVLPQMAFKDIHSLTLLALDGNPMATLPEETFVHLNSTLRGLSLGGRFLTCDCNIAWIVDWIQKYDLQVTSRERNPQFCGHPQHLRDRNFYQLSANDLICGPPPTRAPPPTTTTTTTEATKTREPELFSLPPTPARRPPQSPPTNHQMFRPQVINNGLHNKAPHPSQNPQLATPSPTVRPGDIITEIKMMVGQESQPPRNRNAIPVPPPQIVSTEPSLRRAENSRRQLPPGLALPESNSAFPQSARSTPSPRPILPPPPNSLSGQIISRPREDPSLRPNIGPNRPRSVQPPEPQIINKANLGVGASFNQRQRPPALAPQRSETDVLPRHQESLIDRSTLCKELDYDEVIVRDAYKEDNSIVIKWHSEVTNILGFRVVYRLFGKPEFKQGPPLAPSEREFRIKNVPSNECIVVCVVSLEELKITPNSVPFEQCREIRTEGVGTSQKLDWIIIPASAAIVATVIIAVIIFIACLKTSQKSREAKILDEKPIHTLSMSGMGTLTAGPPLAGLASIGLGPTSKDWDQISMYSQRTDRSIPRSRMYHMERAAGSLNGGFIPEDARSHLSALSQRTTGRSKSIGDLTGKAYLTNGAFGLGLSRQELQFEQQIWRKVLSDRLDHDPRLLQSYYRRFGYL